MVSVVLFGLVIGSFLNVCIYRVPRKISLVNPVFSFCPQCNTNIRVSENIPVLSWIIQKGKCAHCDQKISFVYPLVELLSAAFAVLSYATFGLTATGIIVYVVCASLIVISFIDFEFKIIPNVISFPGIIFGLLLGIASQFSNIVVWPLTHSALDSLLGMIVGGGFFYLIGFSYYLVTKRVGLGGGDVKLMAMTGAILGIESIAPTIFCGSLIGAIIGITLIAAKKGGRHTEIPFGPWLSVGTMVYIFFDPQVFRFF